MNKDWQTIELCDRFFDAIEQHDYDALESCYAPEAVVWHSHDMLYQPRADNLAMLKKGMESGGKTRFKDRRVRAFEGGFVQQHTIHVTRADGFVIQYTLNGVMKTGHQGALWLCIVGKVEDGKITRIDEYMDSGKFVDWMGGPR